MRMLKFCRPLFSLLAASAVLLGASAASAAPLASGSVLFPAPAEPDPAGGVVIFDSGPIAFVAPTFTGTLHSQVISGDANNPYGGLTFLYQVSNTGGSVDGIGRVTLNLFDNWLADVSYLADVNLIAPAYADRAPNGDVIGFSFANMPLGAGMVTPGTTSAWMVVQTNAPAFIASLAAVIDGSTAMVASVSPVPEPSTFALAAIAVLGALVPLRRRRK
jgi:MYXO-CTERM domain-containing protein